MFAIYLINSDSEIEANFSALSFNKFDAYIFLLPSSALSRQTPCSSLIALQKDGNHSLVCFRITSDKWTWSILTKEFRISVNFW